MSILSQYRKPDGERPALPSKESLADVCPLGTPGCPDTELPASTELESLGSEVVNDLLDEEDEQEEQAEVDSASSILAALGRLQSSISNPTSEQQHDMTTIRASARSLIRLHDLA